MVISAKGLITFTWRSLFEHPILAGMFFFVILLYRFTPYLFNLLVFFSPVITCTGLLLGVLLSYGQPAVPGMEDETDDDPINDKDDAKHRPKVDKNSSNVFHDSRAALLSESDEEEDTREGPTTNSDLLEEDSAEAHGSWGHIDRHDASESDSDHAESSSPDASMTDILPMLYELHPLLDSEDPQPLNPSTGDAHSESGTSSEESESEEEAENTEEGQDEETKEKNEDEAELAVRWTEDDEKNVMVLGTSELERNQRLENLIAKRKARKNAFLAERNLIDLDGVEPISSGLSHFQAQIHHISIPRHNPFDLPYESEEAFGLHQIPGSAPSVLLPRQNPFDSPRGGIVEGSNFSGFSGNNQGFAGFHQRETFFRRHESFAHVAPFASEIRFRPYFVSERVISEETSYAHLQNSSRGSGSASSENELPEEKSNQGAEEKLVSEVDESSSDEADSVDSENPHDIDASPHISNVVESPDRNREAGEDSSGDSTRSLKSFSMEAEVENDAEPVYDLSPSALGKFRAQVASFGEEYIHVAAESLKASSSLPLQGDVSSLEAGGPPNLSPSEDNAIDFEVPEDKDEYEYIEKRMSCSSSASLESDSTENIEQDAGVNQQSTTTDEHPSSGSSTVEDSHLEPKSKSSSAIGEDSRENSELKHEHNEKNEEHQTDDQRNENFNQGVEARVLEPSSSVEVDRIDGNTTHSVEFKSTPSSKIKEKDKSHESDSSSTSSSSSSDSD